MQRFYNVLGLGFVLTKTLLWLLKEVFITMKKPAEDYKLCMLRDGKRVAVIPHDDGRRLDRLSHEVGWKYQKVVATLEAKRKVKSKRYYERKKHLLKLREQAKKNVAKQIEPYQKIMEQFGY